MLGELIDGLKCAASVIALLLLLGAVASQCLLDVLQWTGLIYEAGEVVFEREPIPPLAETLHGSAESARWLNALLADMFFTMGGGKKLVAVLKEAFTRAIQERMSSSGDQQEVRLKVTGIDLGKRVPVVKRVQTSTDGTTRVVIFDFAYDGGARVGLSMQVFRRRKRHLSAQLAVHKMPLGRLIVRLGDRDNIGDKGGVNWSMSALPPFEVVLNFGERHLRRISTIVHVLTEGVLRSRLAVWPIQRSKVIRHEAASPQELLCDADPVRAVKLDILFDEDTREQHARSLSSLSPSAWTVSYIRGAEGEELTAGLPVLGWTIATDEDDLRLSFTRAALPSNRSSANLDSVSSRSVEYVLDVSRGVHRVPLIPALFIRCSRSFVSHSDFGDVSVKAPQGSDQVVTGFSWRNVKYLLERVYRAKHEARDEELDQDSDTEADEGAATPTLDFPSERMKQVRALNMASIAPLLRAIQEEPDEDEYILDVMLAVAADAVDDEGDRSQLLALRANEDRGFPPDEQLRMGRFLLLPEVRLLPLPQTPEVAPGWQYIPSVRCLYRTDDYDGVIARHALTLDCVSLSEGALTINRNVRAGEDGGALYAMLSSYAVEELPTIDGVGVLYAPDEDEACVGVVLRAESNSLLVTGSEASLYHLYARLRFRGVPRVVPDELVCCIPAAPKPQPTLESKCTLLYHFHRWTTGSLALTSSHLLYVGVDNAAFVLPRSCIERCRTSKRFLNRGLVVEVRKLVPRLYVYGFEDRSVMLRWLQQLDPNSRE